MPRLLLMAALLVGGTASPVSRADDRPNVLLLLSDDQRPDTIHALGNEVIRTPHLDRLVHEGTSFTRAITAIPICVASRAELLTGRDGLSNGRGDYGFTPTADARFWAEAMRDAGYVTGYVGKWHTPGRPSERGYLHAVGLYAGGAAREPLACPLDFKGMPATGYRGWVFQTDERRLFLERGVGLTPDISEDFAAAAIAFLRQPRSGPFCLHVNFTAPHDPLLLPTRFRAAYDPAAMPLPPNFAPRHPFDHGNAHGRDEQLLHSPRMPDETRRTLAVYYAVIEHLDEQVGRILAALEAGGELDRTLVIFSSDHGLALGSHGLCGKQNLYEHSIGVPLILRGPGVPRGRRLSTQCYLRDLIPTACDLCRVPIPGAVEGQSLRPLLEGSRERLYDATFAHFRDVQRMIRTDEWKYIVYPQARQEQLFRLSDDPPELHNRIHDPDCRAIAAELRRRLTEWRRRQGDPTLTPGP